MIGNKIRDEGAKVISEMLKINTTLALLDLESKEEGRKDKKETNDD